MKILMLTHRFPYPPVRGDCIRSWGEIEYLSERHGLWLACVDRTAPWPSHLATARQRCRDVAVVVRTAAASLMRGGMSLLGGASLTEGYFWDARLARLIRRWGKSVGFDAVLTFSPAMAPYARLVDAGRRVLDMNDVESAKWAAYAQQSVPPLRWMYAWEACRLPRAEAAWIGEHDVSLLVNERERAKLPVEQRRTTAVVRTGIALDRYEQQHAAASCPTVPREPVIGFVGSMSYAPNVRAVNWFGEAIWPRVREALPEARWHIVGSRPVRSVRRWGQRPGITVTGFVEDVRPRLRMMRAFVCPVREQIGVQTKLIEAMAAARAAVVTPEVAAGIDFNDPPPFVIAGSPADFAQAVVQILRDEAHARALAIRARAVAEANYNVEDQMRSIERWLTGEETTVAPVSAAQARSAELLAALPRGAHRL